MERVKLAGGWADLGLRALALSRTLVAGNVCHERTMTWEELAAEARQLAGDAAQLAREVADRV